MKTLVTGGTGFIGSNIVKQLLSEGHEVFISGNSDEQSIDGRAKVLFHSFDDADWESKVNSAGKFDAVFHQAAINDTTLMDVGRMMFANLDASKKLFKIVSENGCKRIVYASSTAGYGDAPAPYIESKTVSRPLNPYGESKKLLDDFAMGFAAQNPDSVIVGLRYCNVYGPGESHKGKRSSMIYQLAQQMKTANPKIFWDGEQKRDYVYVEDVVRANELAAISYRSCVVNCGSGVATTFNEIIRILNDVLKTNREVEYIPMPETLNGKYQVHTECDMSAASELIRFIPQFNIRLGIERFYKSGRL